MHSCIFLVDYVQKKLSLIKIFRYLFQIKPFWPPGLDLASRLICRSADFIKVWLIQGEEGIENEGRALKRLVKRGAQFKRINVSKS